MSNSMEWPNDIKGEAEEIIKLTKSTGCRYGVFNLETGEFMGTCGFHCWQQEGDMEKAEMGYDLSPEFWGKGYMSEALEELIKVGFEVMQLSYVEAHVEQDNIRSQQLLKKLDFQLDDLHQDHLMIYKLTSAQFISRQTFKQAVSLREAGNADQSRELWLSLLEKNPDHPVILYQTAWTHDVLGLEREAVPFYEKAIELGLPGEELAGAMMGLGSTYRTLGEYEKAKALFEQAAAQFPDRKEFIVFYSMVLYNLGENPKAMEGVLTLLAETSADEGIQSYRRAISFYADKLDKVW